MVPKLFKAGKSFKSCAAYLLHDPERATSDSRVRWTHTLNLAQDHPALAVHEMLWTYRAADDLKQAAGIKAGGRALENPVRHFSLNWHPSENPDREHMIATVQHFLEHMQWHERQALIVCHDDKHPHVHVMINSVHPETGLALDTAFEKRRAQEWALAYEKQHDLIFCEERLKPAEERTPSPTRETWAQLRTYEHEEDREEVARLGSAWEALNRKSSENLQDRPWEILKEHQRKEREQFFIDGKDAYRAVRHEAYREVRETFREEWRGYFEARRDGLDANTLAAMKADILTRQKESLETQRNEAATELRAERDKDYAALLQRQQEQRRELRQSQEAGRTHGVLDIIYGEDKELARGRDSTDTHLVRSQRTTSPTRVSWDELRASERREPPLKTAGYFERDDARTRAELERAALKIYQRERREALAEASRKAHEEARKHAREEVRAALAPRWAQYRAAKASGIDRSQLAATRAALLRQQRETFKARTEAAVAEARSCQNKERAALAQRQGEERNELRTRQLQGLPSYRLLDTMHGGGREKARTNAARASATRTADEARSEEEGRQKAWRQPPVEPLARSNPDNPVRNRETDAARSTDESTRKTAEREDAVRRAWRQARPGRGRD